MDEEKTVVEGEVAGDTRPKRERKQTSVYKPPEAADSSSKKGQGVDIVGEAGSGVQLADYPYFLRGLEKLRGDDEVVKSLHHLLYGTVGKKAETKKNLRLFSGFPAGGDGVDKKVDLGRRYANTWLLYNPSSPPCCVLLWLWFVFRWRRSRRTRKSGRCRYRRPAL